MLLTLTLTAPPATDLGFLLHKHPARAHERALTFGRGTVFYPEIAEDRCTAALLVEVDALALKQRGSAADHYVSDRPYAASSFLSVAMARLVPEAMAGRSKERPALAAGTLPFEATVTPLPVRGDAGAIARLFEPLGYAVDLDEVEGGYGRLRLRARTRLADLLTHLYVLIPVLDDRKHYFVGDDEVEKLLARGAGWLGEHPERELIATRYLKRRPSLVSDALARLAEAGDETALDPEGQDRAEELLERPLRLHDQRLDVVAAELAGLGAKRVLDLGCGSGRLLARLVALDGVERVVGIEVASAELARAARWRERLPPAWRDKVELRQGSLLYRDRSLRGFDAAALVEVIEHVEPGRLPHVERNLFGDAAPGAVIVTTPNRDCNPLLGEATLRHPDHRFEWGRAEFEAWSAKVAASYGYTVRHRPIGEVHPACGAPSQMAVFSR